MEYEPGVTLSVAVVFEARFPGDPRLSLLREPLVARGDAVHTWALEANAPPLSRLGFYAQVVRELIRLRTSGSLDALVLSGSPRALGALAALGRLGEVQLILDLSLDPADKVGGAVDVALAAAASRVLARDPTSYQALLDAGVPAYRAGLLCDPLTFAPSVPARAKEPPVRAAFRVWTTAVADGELDVAIEALATARTDAPKLQGQLAVPAGWTVAAQARADARALPIEVRPLPAEPESAPDPGLAEAHLALVIGASEEARRAAGQALAAGVPLVWLSTEAGRGSEGAERVSSAAMAAQALSVLARDNGARAALLARGRAWDDAYGWGAQSRLWLRAVDAACEAKVVAERRARQAAIEGVKTGTRKDS